MTALDGDNAVDGPCVQKTPNPLKARPARNAYGRFLAFSARIGANLEGRQR
jgi:hypothetical protein